MSFKETIQKIKNEYNIVDYIKINGVHLENSGKESWKGLCPFHNEKTPSFHVSEDFQNYKCWGCGISGDIISFAEHVHTINFNEALKMLAEEKGIKLNDNIPNESAHDINAIRYIMSDAKDFFRYNYEQLDYTHPAKQEVINRGLDENNELYGYSLENPNKLYEYLKTKGHSDKNIKDSNLVMFFEDRPPWDFFHGRLMITLSDYLGRPVSFTSRKIYEDDKMLGKYVNGKESPVFHKKSILFGADVAKQEARKTNIIHVVEGQFDQISMFENGIKNVVATSGTAFTNEHANLLLRMVGSNGKIIFIMDGDEAGVNAAIKVFTTSKSLHSSAYAILLKEGGDPCDYIRNSGIESLKKEIDKAIPLHDFVIDSILRNIGDSINVNNRHKFVAEVAKFAKHSDESFIIDSMLSKASILSAISIDNVKEIYNKIEANKTYIKKVESNNIKLNPKIKLNVNNEADLCMFSALALLVRMPDELIPITPKLKHKKFHEFLDELGKVYVKNKKANNKWRFIAEDYSDSDFAIALQNKLFLEDPKEDVKSAMSQYKYLFDRANLLYDEEIKEMKAAKALSSIIDITDPNKIAKVLNMYNKYNTTQMI